MLSWDQDGIDCTFDAAGVGCGAAGGLPGVGVAQHAEHGLPCVSHRNSMLKHILEGAMQVWDAALQPGGVPGVARPQHSAGPAFEVLHWHNTR